ncbi:MAG: LysE family transporter, partial [Candidatus Bathyarchaeota archaeon]
MELLDFIATVVLVTASGALAPGPLFFAAVSHGTKSGARGGLAFSIGHTLVELPLVLLLAFVFGKVASQVAGEPAVKISTGIAG